MRSLWRLAVASVVVACLSSACDLSPNIDLPSAESDSTTGDGDGDDTDLGDGDGFAVDPTTDDMGGGSSTCPARAGAGGARDDCYEE